MLIKDEVQPSNVDGKKGATNRRGGLSGFWYAWPIDATLIFITCYS
jgi:hypothetical protein